MQVIDRKTLKSATGGQYGSGRGGNRTGTSLGGDSSGGGTTMGTRNAPPPRRR